MTWRAPLWRIVRTSGEHARPWWEPRTYGPLATMRWDPHLPPPSEQPGRGVLYAADTLAGAAAEAWQAARRIDVRTGDPAVVRFTPKPLRLLDLTAAGRFLIRNGTAASAVMGSRRECRRWAAGMVTARPDLDGLVTPSTLTGTNVVLFAAGAAKVPREPGLIHRADDPTVHALLRRIAEEIGYGS
ncbi:RES domain-containing protein [Demequina subtropica]|uniref:RES domain-containing protein n=1 Tax=Demequina subtropica TaxID=1638989 RepID=UPI00147004E7|nr:RES domain-containing protein [Demequina subtropica]